MTDFIKEDHVTALQKALEFYADKSNWRPADTHDPATGVTCDVYIPPQVEFDMGNKARLALFTVFGMRFT